MTSWGNWQYSWLGASTLGLQANEWIDYPRVGTNADFIVATGNIYQGTEPNATYVTSFVLVLDKSAYYATAATTMATFRGSVAFTTVPCRIDDKKH
jgi:hypothetical protein